MASLRGDDVCFADDADLSRRRQCDSSRRIIGEMIGGDAGNACQPTRIIGVWHFSSTKHYHIGRLMPLHTYMLASYSARLRDEILFSILSYAYGRAWLRLIRLYASNGELA